MGTVSAIYGLAGAVLVPLSLTPLFFAGNISHPMLDQIRYDGTLTSWVMLSSVPGVIAMLLLLVGGTGLLNRRAWGRRWLLYGAAIEFLLAVLAAVMMVRLVGTLRTSTSNPRYPQSILLAVLYVVGKLIFPVFLLVYLNRRGVRDAFLRRAKPDAVEPLPPQTAA